jgi:hypothetical protein
MTRARLVTCAAVLAATAAIAACAQLLGIRPPDAAAFPHRAHTVAGVSCADCHAGVDEAGERGALHFPTTETCVGCHEEPHNPATCSNCHAEPFVARRASGHREHLRFQHRTHMRPGGDGERRRLECVACHGGIAETGGRLEARMGTCVSCHAHEETMRLRQCDGCHVDLVAEAAPPESHFIHDERFIESHGVQAASAADLCATCHTESDCAVCHGRSVAIVPSRRSFTDPFRGNMHRAGFLARHAEEARGMAGLCTSCHAESFCLSCHLDERVSATAPGARSPHPPGWVGATAAQNAHGPAARRDPMSCAACHSGAGEQLCIDCHRVGGVGGSPHPPGWSSSRSLYERPCRSCHIDL